MQTHKFGLEDGVVKIWVSSFKDLFENVERFRRLAAKAWYVYFAVCLHGSRFLQCRDFPPCRDLALLLAGSCPHASTPPHLRPRPTLATDWTNTPGVPTRRAYSTLLSTGINKENGKEYIAYGHGILAILRPLDDLNQPIIFAQHAAKVTVVTISPDGTVVGSGDESGTVHLWELNAKMEVKGSYKIGSCVTDIRFSKDSKKFVAGGDGNFDYVRAYFVGKTNMIGKIDRITKKVLSIDWSPTEDTVVCSDENKEVNFYKGPIFKHAARTSKHTRYPNVVRFSPDGETVASAGSDFAIHLYKKDGAYLGPLGEAKDSAHTMSIYGMAWSPDGKQIATASADKTVKVWSVADGALVKAWTVSNGQADLDEQQVGLTWAKSGAIITAGLSGALNFFSLDQDAQTKTLVSPTTQGGVTGFAIDRKAQVIYTQDNLGRVGATEVKDGTTRWFDNADGKLTGMLAMGLSADGTTLYHTCPDLSIRATDVSKSKVGAPFVALPTVGLAIGTSNKSAGMLAVSTEKSLFLIKDGSILSEAACAGGKQIVFSPDDASVAVAGGSSKVVYVFRISPEGGLSEGFTLDNDTGAPVNAIVWDAKRGLISASGNTITVWSDAAKGATTRTPGWVYHSAAISSLKFPPSGGALVSASQDKSVCFWADFEKFRPTAKQVENTHTIGILFADFADDTTYVTMDQEFVLKRWTVGL